MKHLKLLSFLLSCNVFLVLILEVLFVVNIDAKLPSANNHDFEDNEFAEFEEFDEEDDERMKMNKVHENIEQNKESLNSKIDQLNDSKEKTSQNRNNDGNKDDSDGIVEDEDDYEDEFDNLKDSEEFERNDKNKNTEKSSGKDDLKITNIPIHLQSNWESFYLEFIMIAGLIVYFLNFITGRNKNHNIANAWLQTHKELLEQNFSLVGDDGKKEIENYGLIKETENIFTLWCSGRVSVEGMLVELKFMKRQDLVSIISSYFKPSTDQIIVKIYLNSDAMDTFVFCLANKKTAVKLAKELNDISTYCPDRKSTEKYGVNSDLFHLMNEVGEVGNALLDPKVVSLIEKYEKSIDFIHISDQYSGNKYQEETQLIKLPDVKKMMIFCFNCDINTANDRMEELKPLMQLVFYLLEKVRRLRLSKEGKMKADKNRQKVEEIFLKATHAQRQEAAQIKREEKRRAEKERILNEEDPDKQRRWEEKEYKREMRRKTPRMKQLKVKAM